MLGKTAAACLQQSIEDMGFKDKEGWLPGVSTRFGSFDPFCSVWHFFAFSLTVSVIGQPQYHY